MIYESMARLGGERFKLNVKLIQFPPLSLESGNFNSL